MLDTFTFDRIIEKANQDLVIAQETLTGLKAEKYIAELFENTTYTCQNIDVKNAQLFRGNGYYYYVQENKLLKAIQNKAKYFRNIDDSRDWPTWKHEAYKQAKIYQQYFNKYIKI